MDTCYDFVRNGDETDIDCGGATCWTRCGSNASCHADEDCLSASCMDGICTTLREAASRLLDASGTAATSDTSDEVKVVNGWWAIICVVIVFMVLLCIRIMEDYISVCRREDMSDQRSVEVPLYDEDI